MGYAFARLASIIAATTGNKIIRFKPSDFIVDFDSQFRKSQPITEAGWNSFKSMMKALGKSSKHSTKGQSS